MFDKIRRALGGKVPLPIVSTGIDHAPQAAANAYTDFGALELGGSMAAMQELPAVSQWATSRGYTVTHRDRGGFSLSGSVMGKGWRLERGKPSRDYIVGEELRARAELGIDENVAVLLMNRALKDSLEKRAFSLYTDSLQTIADPSLPEEMRWLSMYEEFGWDAVGRNFWDRFALLADSRDRAMTWLSPELARDWMRWPEGEAQIEIPMLFMVLRGKAYLRMQYTPATVETLDRAVHVFLVSCEAAITGLSTDLVV